MDWGREALASKLEAIDVIVKAVKAVNRAKKAGVDVKSLRLQMKESARALRAGDFRKAMDIAEQVLAPLSGLPESHP